MINRDVPGPLRIALLGAAATGKTQLAAALVAALSVPGRPAFLNGDSGLSCGELHESTPHAVLIADSPPLPIQQPPCFDLTLLMGLDLPRQGSADLAHERERESDDQMLRHALTQGGVAYKVIYGLGPERLQNALGALDALLPCSKPGLAPVVKATTDNTKWVWTCDKCSDPQCERRLLSDLLARR